MKTSSILALVVGACAGVCAVTASVVAPDLSVIGLAPPNPRIDYPAFEQKVIETGPLRELRRLDEDAFLRMMRLPGVVVLDARTDWRYRSLHIAGAVNLPFTEFTAETLAAVIPSFDTPVLIYCNNNFGDRLDVFPTKLASASLNVSTFTALRTYGYENVFELGPLLRVETSRLPFAGETAKEALAAP